MKKNLTIILAIALSFGVFAQQNTWPSALGNVSFATDSTWTISGNGIFQIWSDAVQTDYCSNKTSFRGGVDDGAIWDPKWVSFNIDCRSNPYHKGDLFSWRAVHDLKEELCPYPWRVPTKQDFVDLDIALGGTGKHQIRVPTLRDKYLNDWGGDNGGFCSGMNGVLFMQGFDGRYWSQSEFDINHAFFLFFSSHDHVRASAVMDKANGHSLRCVRDN